MLVSVRPSTSATIEEGEGLMVAGVTCPKAGRQTRVETQSARAMMFTNPPQDCDRLNVPGDWSVVAWHYFVRNTKVHLKFSTTCLVSRRCRSCKCLCRCPDGLRSSSQLGGWPILRRSAWRC